MTEPLNAGSQRWTPFLTILLTAVIFDRLFHELSLGLNLLLFALLITALLLHRHGWKGLSVPARWTLGGLNVAAGMVVVHASTVAMIAAVIALGVSTSLAHERQLRSLFYAIQQWFSNVVYLPMAAWDGAGVLLQGRNAPRQGWGWGKLAVLPVLIGAVFFHLYRVGNPRFEELTAGFLNGIWEVLGDLLTSIFTAHTFFFLYAMAVSAALLYRFAPKRVLQWEQNWTDALLRRKVLRPQWMAPQGMNLLERERRMGVLLLVLVNALLLVVNVIDIGWVWVGFEVPEGFSLKQFVHEGTWILIISILLSIAILLHLFRGNQNFYVRSALLKRLAMLWVVQNFILGISVFLRNYHYISFHGLAYKRIGVIVFLVLVLIGLVTLFVKLRERKSFFYLVRVNGWAAFAVLVGLTLVDWDSFIVRTNLRHTNPGEIDIDNYLAMSDKVLPLLYADIDLVEEQMARHRNNRVRWVENLDPLEFRRALDAKRDRFIQRRSDQRWQEWNLADERTARYFITTP
jgi:hypothetical protein